MRFSLSDMAGASWNTMGEPKKLFAASAPTNGEGEAEMTER
jgi:hypothetical protein